MRVLILGGDGYLGWPTAMAFAAKSHEVCLVDNYLRRRIAMETESEALIPTPNLNERARIFESATGIRLHVEIANCADYALLSRIVRDFDPEAIIHYAEQPSAPYSMIGFSEANLTLQNNLGVTFNIIWAVLEHAPQCHIIKLGTMGEYGTPNIDIEEGWIEIEHHGRKDKFLYPRQAGSLYHTTKVLDTDLLWFYVRTYRLRVTDLMQGPVYGLSTAQADLDERLLPNFHYDDIFGTVVNRFLVQAVAGIPLTVYGRGGQTRGYLNVNDTLQCVELAATHPSEPGQLRIFNQFTEQFTVNELADTVKRAAHGLGIEVAVESIPNPRKELEEHYYNPRHSGLIELGLQPHYLTEEVLTDMLQRVLPYRDRIDRKRIMPRVRWAG
ncbi:MAG: NAD-dependent epimerase/dehydratase family protein [Gammaproteobacteria bacterium]|nr:NAD-dependent epimerase/dehydratase family protein [Gammaproteobacteria bacterium]